jgi:ribosomal protein L31E
MLQNYSMDEQENLPNKGKAVQIEHHLFDELWNMGSQKMPQEVSFKNEDGNLAENEEEKKENEI